MAGSMCHSTSKYILRKAFFLMEDKADADTKRKYEKHFKFSLTLSLSAIKNPEAMKIRCIFIPQNKKFCINNFK